MDRRAEGLGITEKRLYVSPSISWFKDSVLVLKRAFKVI